VRNRGFVLAKQFLTILSRLNSRMDVCHPTEKVRSRGFGVLRAQLRRAAVAGQIETSGLIESKPERGRSFHLGEISVAARASRAALNADRKNSVTICRIRIRRFVVYTKLETNGGGKEHGKACIRFAAVLGRLRRPPGNGATWPRATRHFVEHVRDLAGCVYGRRTYEIMRYWDEDQPDWDAADLDFAAAWRSLPKWVVSRSLKAVGPNATLVQNDVGTVLREIKARLVGEIDVAGPDLARSLTDLGLVDEYRLYFRPFVLGHGTPFFAGPRPPLRLVASDLVGEGVIRLTYVPA
jgi:dihydrofolate reductase